MSDEPVGDEGYDEWLAAVAEGEAFYLACPNGHGSLPPRRLCPHCGSRELDERPLPATGEIQTFTETHVPIPAFEEDAPYVVAIASFGDVQITGQLQGIDPGEIAAGLSVTLDVAQRTTTEEPLVVFEPA